MRPEQTHQSRVWGYEAALWALIFAVFHAIWATGRYVGLNAETARIAFAKTPFFVYDLVVAGISGKRVGGQADNAAIPLSIYLPLAC